MDTRHASTAAEGPTDAELIGRFAAGNEDAFTILVRRHRAYVYATAMGLIHDALEAEEIVQDTFLRAYRKLAQFRGDCALSTWLYRIAVNASRNRYWYLFRRRRHLSVSLDAPMFPDGDRTLAESLPSNAPTPDQHGSDKDFTELVRECMDRLPAHQREILILRGIRDLSYAEIASEMGLQIGTVKSRIARAREHLRQLLEKVCPDLILVDGGR
jgi:RNA polymerase sigma-70 factor (ECF subfamily)